MTEFQDSEVLSVASVCEVWSGVSPTAWSCSLEKRPKSIAPRKASSTLRRKAGHRLWCSRAERRNAKWPFQVR